MVKSLGILTTPTTANMETMEAIMETTTEDLKYLTHRNTQKVASATTEITMGDLVDPTLRNTQKVASATMEDHEGPTHQNIQVSSEGRTIHRGFPSPDVVVMVMLKPEPSGPSTMIMTVIRMTSSGHQDLANREDQIPLIGPMTIGRTGRRE